MLYIFSVASLGCAPANINGEPAGLGNVGAAVGQAVGQAAKQAVGQVPGTATGPSASSGPSSGSLDQLGAEYCKKSKQIEDDSQHADAVVDEIKKVKQDSGSNP